MSNFHARANLAAIREMLEAATPDPTESHQRHVESLAARLYSTYFQSNPSNDQDYAELTARRALSAARAIIAQNREGKG